MTTLATFLSEKAGNMRKWLEGEGLERIRAPTDIEIVTFAVLCATDLKTVIRERNLNGLTAGNLPLEITKVLDFVRCRDELHDKFWRYLELFSEVASTDE